MHEVDGEWISTGSWNYTDGDTYRLNNNMIVMRSRELAANYTAEFEKMFVQRKFGPAKPKGVPNPVVTVGGVRCGVRPDNARHATRRRGLPVAVRPGGLRTRLQLA